MMEPIERQEEKQDNETRPVYVVGHKNPDTDSICSAIAYAHLKNQSGTGRYVPKRAGAVNNETQFVLSYFGVEAPSLLEDVNVQMRDIDYRKTKGVSDTISLRTAWKKMKDEDVVTLPIVRGENKLHGLITINDIAISYMDVYENTTLAKARTPIGNLMEVLEGELILGNPHARIVKGKTIIAAAQVDLVEASVDEDDVVIVANREDVQREAIEHGASCLIVCLGAKVSEEMIAYAKEKQCSIISTRMDTFAASRTIYQSIPIRYFMRKNNLVTFQLDDTLDEVKETMSTLRHRDFPITDDVGTYYGMVSRRNLLAMRRKQVILVDHNEKTQAVNGIENAEIIEVIDHHKIGSLETINPVYFRNQPVGCTGTIIYQMYREQNVIPTKTIAGLLCATILSDTLMFRSPTCTALDEQTALELAKIAEIDVESFAMDMFAAGSDLAGKTAEEIFYQDYKTFQIADVTFGIGQINSMNQQELTLLGEKMEAYLQKNYLMAKCDMIFFTLTNILEESSTLLCYGDKALDLAKEAFSVEAEGVSCYLKGVVSRKKQLVPALVTTLQQWENM